MRATSSGWICVCNRNDAVADPLARYLLVAFTYGCNLGPSQAARHLRGLVTAHDLGAIARRHVTVEKQNLALADVVNWFAQLDLARIWGDGSSVVADGTKYEIYVDNLLAEYHIKATFCIIGRQVAAHPDVIRRIVADGHSLCNHTWDHDLMLQKRSAAQITAEMQRTNDAIHAVVPGAPIRYFRAPGGGFSPQIVQIAAGMGMKSLYWQVDPQDWRGLTGISGPQSPHSKYIKA